MSEESKGGFYHGKMLDASGLNRYLSEGVHQRLGGCVLSLVLQEGMIDNEYCLKTKLRISTTRLVC